MAFFKEGKVAEIIENTPTLIRVTVDVDDARRDAAGFPEMLGPIEVGDRVVVNMTGIDLDLGTGGVAFVLWNLDGPGPQPGRTGHIVKLRYTPWQMNVMAAEAPESEHHAALESAESIDSMPVVACGLHSQVAAVVAGIKAKRPDSVIGYLMTDAAALPLAWSRLIRQLTDAHLLEVTATAGHAFGGDLETVNVFSGLAVLRHVGRTDVTVVAPGPGVVGTDTPLGFSAIEQGQVLDAATALGGRAVACLRISFSDERERHRGISHHALTALKIGARETCTVVVPELPQEQASYVADQLRASGVWDRHEGVVVRGDEAIELLEDRGISPTSMGRSLRQVPELFVAAGAAGIHAAALLEDS
ncbi:MAG: DUF3866 family protein [Actinomycetota bacterium]|nr:DUF3866 family protein [Actinomycetota bacterium]